MRRTVVLTVLAGCLAAVALAQPPSPDRPAPKPPTIEELIAQLSGRDFRQREAAGRQLQERADEALPALRKALPLAEPEARRRMSVLLQKVENRSLMAGRRITGHYIKRPLPEIVADFTKQTGYRIDLQGEAPNPRLTLELKDVPFWQAFDRLARDAGMVPGTNDALDALVLMNQDSYVPYVYHTGPFRLAAQGLSLNKNLNLAAFPRTPNPNNLPNSDSFSFSFSLAAEPKLPLLGLGQPVVTAAEDDRGRSLLFPGNENAVVSFYNGGSKSLMQTSSVALVAPARDATTLKLLKGNVPVTLLLDQRPSITVEKPLAVKKKKFASPHYDLELSQVTEVPSGGPNAYQVEVVVKTALPAGVDDGSWLNTLNQRLELLDEKGKRYVVQNVNENVTPGSIQAMIQFAQGDDGYSPPARLVLYHWVVANHTVPFEFKDIPLP